MRTQAERNLRVQSQKERQLEEEAKTKKEEEIKEEDSLKRELEEKERKEQQEYEKWKEFMTLEETGTKLEEEKDDENLLKRFLDYVKLRKTVSIEDLAMAFDLTNKACLQRLNSLIESGMLTGVIDERGKFLFIDKKEIGELLRTIKDRGQFSRGDLIEAFSEIIRQEPTEEDLKQIREEEESLMKEMGRDFQDMMEEDQPSE